MYDVYQHKFRTNRRLLVGQGRPIPRVNRTEARKVERGCIGITARRVVAADSEDKKELPFGLAIGEARVAQSGANGENTPALFLLHKRHFA
jgi:hypothetical protein